MGNRSKQSRFLPTDSVKTGFSLRSRKVFLLSPGSFLFVSFLFLIIFLHTFQEVVLASGVLKRLNMHIRSLGKNVALVCLQQCQQHAGQHCRLLKFCHGNIYGACLFNTVFISLISTITPFLYTSIFVARGMMPCFLKGLENKYQVPLLFSFVHQLANHRKMVGLTQRLCGS